MVISVLFGSEERPLGQPAPSGCTPIPGPGCFHPSPDRVSYADTEAPAQGLGAHEQGLHCSLPLGGLASVLGPTFPMVSGVVVVVAGGLASIRGTHPPHPPGHQENE